MEHSPLILLAAEERDRFPVLDSPNAIQVGITEDHIFLVRCED
jgi:hypothetical protein